jgi:hypothetical protein
MKSLRHPATIISIVALVVALTGTAGAISMINGSQIKNGTITGVKLRNSTITGTKIANHTIPQVKMSRPLLRDYDGEQITLAPGQHMVTGAVCPRSWTAISGGYSLGSVIKTGFTASFMDVEPAYNVAVTDFSNTSSTDTMTNAYAIVTCMYTP